MPAGVYIRTKEHLLHMSLAMKGKNTGKNSPEHCKNISLGKRGKKCPKVGEAHSGEKNYNWKGGSKVYIHKLIEKQLGKATEYKCKICKVKQAKHWSNIDHKYSKDTKDYQPLCVSCHTKFDIKFNGRIMGPRKKSLITNKFKE